LEEDVNCWYGSVGSDATNVRNAYVHRQCHDAIAELLGGIDTGIVLPVRGTDLCALCALDAPDTITKEDVPTGLSGVDVHAIRHGEPVLSSTSECDGLHALDIGHETERGDANDVALTTPTKIHEEHAANEEEDGDDDDELE